jgi:hypothetical protein
MGNTDEVKRPTIKSFISAGRKAPQPTINNQTATNMLKAISFKSLEDVRSGLTQAKFKSGHIAPCLSMAFAESENKALLFSKAILSADKPDKESEDHMRALIHWGKDAGSKERQMVCTAFRQKKLGVLLVHGVGEMTHESAGKYMKDFFDSGGDIKDVLEWLEIAGGVLQRKSPLNEDTQGGVIDAIGGAFEDAVDAVTGMVTTVVKAVASAGKSLVDMISDAVGWAANRVSDLVRALIEAGKAIGEILENALKKGLAVLDKFVTGLIKAGKAVADVLAWAVSKTAAAFKATVEAIVKAGRFIANIVADAVKKGVQVVRATVKALVELGKKTFDILHGLLRAGVALIKEAVDVLLRSGRLLCDIIADACSQVLASVVDPLIRALIQLGRSVSQIISSIAQKGAEVIMTVAKTLVQIGQKVGEIVHSALGFAARGLEAVLKGILLAGKKVGEVLFEAVKFVGGKLKEVVQALVTIGAKIGDILVGIAKSGVSAIRSALEGLFAVGVKLVDAIVSICKDVAEAFRRGFFEGLIALGRAPLEILKEAFKAGASILALAFAVFIEMWGGYRALEKDELQEARRVFGWSIDLDRVKIAQSNIPADVVNWLNGGRAFTTMYLINFSSKTKKDKEWMHNLIHELTHVWQGVVAGPVYMVEALHSQLFGRGYQVTDADISNAKGDFKNLEREQQATVVEWYWWGRWGGANIDWKRYELLATQVYSAKPSGALMTNPLVPTILLVQPKIITIKG